MPGAIIELGYAGRTVAQVLDLLKPCSTLADVRFRPYSREPEWRREMLEPVCGGKYRWFRSFGNANYQGADVRLHDPERGLEHMLPRLQRNEVIIVLCACRSLARCHRRDVLKFVASRCPFDLYGGEEFTRLPLSILDAAPPPSLPKKPDTGVPEVRDLPLFGGL
jgi:hypothetical protein